MKKFVFTLVLCLVLSFAILASADTPSLLANPDTNVTNPRSLPYTASVANFKTNTTTYSIAGPSDGTITVNVNDAYLDLSGNRTAKVTVTVYYQNTNGYWLKGNSKSFDVTTTADDYPIPLTLPANRIFYIKLSKSSYTGSYVFSNLYITD